MKDKPVWCDPPQGYLYGFPKIYDPIKYPNFYTWIIEEGYPDGVIKSYEGQFYCRFWEVSDDDNF